MQVFPQPGVSIWTSVWFHCYRLQFASEKPVFHGKLRSEPTLTFTGVPRSFWNLIGATPSQMTVSLGWQSLCSRGELATPE